MRIDRMKAEYERLGLCQKTFADAMQTTKQTVNNWELGRRNPTIQMVVEMSKLFGCTTDYLLGTSDER